MADTPYEDKFENVRKAVKDRFLELRIPIRMGARIAGTSFSQMYRFTSDPAIVVGAGSVFYTQLLAVEEDGRYPGIWDKRTRKLLKKMRDYHLMRELSFRPDPPIRGVEYH